MDRRTFIIASGFVLVMFCSKAPETSTTATTSAQVTATAPSAPATQTVTSTSATAAAAPATASLQSQETNWPGVTAEVTEFRRKGNALTAKVRLISRGSERIEPEIFWKDVSLIDAAGGKKYEVLKDEMGTFIASNRQGYIDRWSARMEPGTSQVVWMKFPAPPADVKTITLQMSQMPPFDDLQIQD